MDNHQRLGWALVTIVLVTYGCIFTIDKLRNYVRYTPQTDFTPNSDIQINTPTFDQVNSIQFNTNLMASKPGFIFPDSEPGRATISQLLGWIATAKEIGIEQSHPMPHEGLEEMQIILNDGDRIYVQPAANTLIHKDSKMTTFTWTKPHGYILLKVNMNSPFIRMYSPQLSQWLLTGWKNEITFR